MIGHYVAPESVNRGIVDVQRFALKLKFPNHAAIERLEPMTAVHEMEFAILVHAHDGVAVVRQQRIDGLPNMNGASKWREHAEHDDNVGINVQISLELLDRMAQYLAHPHVRQREF